jgi:hypothetical protein
MRNISLNAHYIVLFKLPRDKQQILMLARQINPGKVQEFMRTSWVFDVGFKANNR